MLDEPLAGLDPMAREMFLEFLERLTGQGVTVLMVSHNLDALAQHAARIIGMKQGKRQQGASDDRTARQRSSADRGAFAGKRCAAGEGGKAERVYTCASGRDGKRSHGRKEDSAGQRASRYL